MTKNKLKIVTLLSFITVLFSCNVLTNSNVSNNKPTTEKEQIDKTAIDSKTESEATAEIKVHTNLRASSFLENLKTGEKLSSFFHDNWIFIYHEDNRCDGSTDGRIRNLKSTQIDLVIKLQVVNDGNGWLCDKRKPKTFILDFDLKKKIRGWDRFKILSHENNREENIAYIVGAGESDYLKLFYNDKGLIVRLEYMSEDPG